MNKVHLICNAHLDPVWLWRWEAGAAEAISTFRVAADFCEEFDGFVFNHNEAVLYQWVEEYEPELFKRIQRLVREGKWHIMGGWFLQPDCNMPSGESFVRQILIGRNYFFDKFGVLPTTGVNMDPFGHTRGIVQILKKSGYDSYMFWRPEPHECELPADDFIWVGFDGSEITGHRSQGPYRADMGHACEKIREWLEGNKDRKCGFVLWGVGNHGGGPSRQDLDKIQKLIKEETGAQIFHSTPEDYVDEIRKVSPEMPKFYGDLNPCFAGCYTSMALIKKKHRMLENSLYMLEKMASHASMNGLAEYPEKDLKSMQRDLAFSEFHDILPGTCIKEGEEDSLRLMDHALEKASRLQLKSFFALTGGQRKAAEGEIPIFVYNPHPFEINGIFECEFNLPERNLDPAVFAMPVVYKDGVRVPCQYEKPSCSINNDWTKKVVFSTRLLPGQMNRFDTRIELVPKPIPAPHLDEKDGRLIFKTQELEVAISTKTGLIDRYRVNGVDYLGENAFLPLVVQDNSDSWGGNVYSFRKVVGQFELMPAEEGMAFSDIREGNIPSVRVVEDGEARTVVEAVLSYGDSRICQTYKLPKQGTEIEINTRAYWNEKSKMLKLSIPTLVKKGKYLGQTAYGVQGYPADGGERVFQKWVGIFSHEEDKALTCINDGIHGSDCMNGEIRLSMLRSPGYAYNMHDAPKRHNLRMDQGERSFTIWINAGPANRRMECVDREALAHNEKPYALSFYPSGAGTQPAPLASLDDDVVQMTVFKKAEKTDDYIIRLYEPTGTARITTLNVPAAGVRQEVHMGAFEIKTLKLDPKTGELAEVNLMEG